MTNSSKTLQTNLSEVSSEYCGTARGCRAHYRAKNKPCEPCRVALNAERDEKRKTIRQNDVRFFNNHREQRKKDKKRYRDANLERSRELNKNNNKKYRENNREWYQERMRSFRRKRRAQVINNGYSPYKESEVLFLYGTDCYLCNEPIDMGAPRRSGKLGWQKGLHIDHVVPISKGGADTIDNVRPAHGICNVTKQATIIDNLESK